MASHNQGFIRLATKKNPGNEVAECENHEARIRSSDDLGFFFLSEVASVRNRIDDSVIVSVHCQHQFVTD